MQLPYPQLEPRYSDMAGHSAYLGVSYHYAE
jgi:hypothetical protein